MPQFNSLKMCSQRDAGAGSSRHEAVAKHDQRNADELIAFLDPSRDRKVFVFFGNVHRAHTITERRSMRQLKR